jgi:hypothetical protein
MSSSSTNHPEKARPQHHDKDMGVAPQPPNSEDSEVSHAAEAAEEENQNLTLGLPFSKARCIALVATLAGASFLNVSQLLSSLFPPYQGLTRTTELVGAGRGHHPPDHRPRPRDPGVTASVDHICVRAHLWVLYALLGSSGRHLREAQDLRLGLGLVRCDDARQPLHTERDCF